MIGCCVHSDDWHGNAGCGFPGCDCKRRILRHRPRRPAILTSCSECLQQPDATGGGHSPGCTRTNLGPDVVEPRGRRLVR
jgi:hypothetical protein